MSSPTRIRLRSALRRRGYDVVTRRPVLADWLRERGVTVVFDVGANEGQFATELRAWGYGGRIVSFEPIPEVAARLRALAASDPTWDVREMALARTTGTSTLHISDLSVFSSLREVLPEGRAFDGRARTVQTVEVAVARLDDVFAQAVRAGERAFVKIDTQGNEADVLDGAAAALERVEGVQLELGVRALYEGEQLASALIARMDALGFRIGQIHPIIFDPDDGFQSLLQFDAVFVRAPGA